ncbi:MAG TPA: hypothetical protein VL128_14425 [Candidatus Eisenbacteria bacterium]|nr:hypothetical protein [Candidatus Eisenbacteria bacterium]
MQQVELRPLSLGEILDRTFSLYRRNFLLFLGISAIPQLLILAVNLVQVLALPTGRRTPSALVGGMSGGSLVALGIVGAIVGIFVYVVAYLFAQGGTIYAVSDVYLGRTTTIGASLRKMRGQLLNLLGVSILNSVAVLIATIFLIIPGIYMACRLITCVPAALLEDLGARESLERSFALTKGSAWPAFVIYFLFLSMLYATMLLFTIPFMVMVAFAARQPGLLHWAMGLMQVGNFCATVLVTPFFLIATSVFYYDMRVRKEAFDLQLMMGAGGGTPAASAGVPSLLT